MQTVTIVNVESIRRAEIGFRTEVDGDKLDVLDEALMLTEDENIVQVELLVQDRVGDSRDFTFNVGSNDFIRITGYLVRKSDLEGFAEHGARHGSTTFGYGAETNTGVTGRSVKRVVSREFGARAPQ